MLGAVHAHNKTAPIPKTWHSASKQAMFCSQPQAGGVSAGLHFMALQISGVSRADDTAPVTSTNFRKAAKGKGKSGRTGFLAGRKARVAGACQELGRGGCKEQSRVHLWSLEGARPPPSNILHKEP